MKSSFLSLVLMSLSLSVGAPARGDEKPWVRHAIDNSSRGADGVRLADVNHDGLPDIVTGWEEGGVIRICMHPGAKHVAKPWPSVTVGKVKSPEDAVLVDLDGDGNLDVVSSCEGKTRTMYVHWAPKESSQYSDSRAWATDSLPITEKKQSWMFALPMQIDGKSGSDLIVASKGNNAAVGWLQSPENPRDLAAWKFHKLIDAGWIMSLVSKDMDGDHDTDVVVSDRKGKNRGVYWLENPGPKAAAAGAKWREHRIGAAGREVMFIDVVDLDNDGQAEVLAAVKPVQVLVIRRSADPKGSWTTQTIHLPKEKLGTAKAVRAGDIDRDGRLDLVFSCEQASAPRSGVIWLSTAESLTDPHWQVHPLSGPQGVKYDLIELIDLDGDGDLDVVTCEERTNLGVVWYENPTR